MQKLALILNLFILIPATTFAGRFNCEGKYDDIQAINYDLSQLLEDELVNNYIKVKNSHSLIMRLSIIKANSPEDFNAIADTKDLLNDNIDDSALTQFGENCQQMYQGLNGDIEDWNEDKYKSLNESCLKDIKSKFETSDINSVVNEYKQKENELENKIVEIQTGDKYQALVTLKKHIAVEMMDNCDFSKRRNQNLNKKEIQSIVCDDALDGFPLDENISSLAKDNLDVIQEVNLKLNQVDKSKVIAACSKLTGTYHGNSINDSNGKPINYTYRVETFDTCKTLLDEHKRSIAKNGDTPQNNDTPQNDDTTQNPEPQKNGDNTAKKKVSDDEFFKMAQGRTVSASDLKESKSLKRKRRKKFWRSAGIVGAAVGATGLIGWGLYEAFKPMSRSTYTPYTPTYTKQRNFSQYQMNPYEMYKYQQFYQGGYQQSPSWVGQTFDNPSSSPYSFEFSP